MPRHPHKQSTNQTTFHLDFFLDDIIGAPHSKLIGVCLKKSDSGDVKSDHLHHLKKMILDDHIYVRKFLRGIFPNGGGESLI